MYEKGPFEYALRCVCHEVEGTKDIAQTQYNWHTGGNDMCMYDDVEPIVKHVTNYVYEGFVGSHGIDSDVVVNEDALIAYRVSKVLRENGEDDSDDLPSLD